MLLELGFIQSPLHPELFLLTHNELIVVFLSKVVDVLLMSGPRQLTDPLTGRLHAKFTLGTIPHGPRKL